MFSWKERLYAFLLRRALGPVLSPESLQKLHECIQFTVSEGSYGLTDIGLNADFLSSKLQQHGLRVVSASVDKVHVQLSLQEHNDSDNSTADSSSNRSSLAWRAIKLASDGSSAAAQPSVSLAVQVVLQGVSITVEACNGPKAGVPVVVQPSSPQRTASIAQQTSATATATATSGEEGEDSASSLAAAQSFLSSYLEAALSSLRLSVDVDNVCVRVRTATFDDGDAAEQQQQEQQYQWIEVRAQSASYRTVRSDAAATGTSADYHSKSEEVPCHETTVLHKVVEVTRITVLTGISDENNVAVPASTVVALLEGTSRCSLRVIEYTDGDDEDEEAQALSHTRLPRAQQDVAVILNQKLNVSVDATSLRQILAVARSFARQRGTDIVMEPDVVADTETKTTTAFPFTNAAVWNQGSSSDDEADFSTLDGIMKQFHEARLLVERKQVRGGILVPSFHDGAGVTFDTFFDANEQSFSRYYSSGVLKESILGDGAVRTAGVPSADWVHTKLRFHFQEGGIKLAFKAAAPEYNCKVPEEYVLLTFNEVNLSSQFSAWSAEHVLSINHLELEDALVATTGGGDDNMPATRTIAIETLLRFSPDADGDDDDDTDLFVQSPCISLSVKSDSSGDRESVDMELTLEPLVVSYRSAAITKLTQLLQTDVQESQVTENVTDSQVLLEAEPRVKTMSMMASCASIAVSLPVLIEKDWNQLYERSGYRYASESTLARKSALGFLFERVSFELHEGTGDAELSSELSVSCHNIIAYASSPMSQRGVFDQRIQRLDVLALCGRTEVDPCIPVSVRVAWCTRDGGSSGKDDDDRLAVKSFPKVPAISTFKARQEDEDEDNRIDRVLSSSLSDFNINRRKELRSADPQSVMLSDVSTSDIVVSIHVPGIIGDVSATELSALRNMVASLRPESDRSSGVITEREDPSPPKRVALSINCDFVSLAIHGDVESSLSSDENYVAASDSFSFMIKVDQFKGHLLMDGSTLRHARILAHEVDCFEILDLAQRATLRDKGCVEERIDFLRQRGTCHAGSRATPIIYRSHLFAPISRKSPSVLLDLLNMSTDKQDFEQKNAYFTIYDTTYRHSFDSRWLKQLASVLPQGDRDDQARPEVTEESVKSLTRIFLSVADCNFDYSSARRFKTASRTILRVGDLRISSNMMWPRVAIQAYTMSLGDVSLYLCNSRYLYNFENGRLLSSQAVLQPDEFMLDALGLPEDAEPDDVLCSMNYRTILTLDSMDSIIAVSNKVSRLASDPSICASFTIGQICMFSCKDSFSLLNTTIGEASAEMTALTDDAFEVLRSKSTESRDAQSVQEASADVDEKAKMPCDPLEDQKKRSLLRPAIGMSWKNDQCPDFLLDGYDWTTIDSCECGKPGIPPGEEQSARWYENTEVASPSASARDEELTIISGIGSDETTKTVPEQNLGPRIITHHFQLHPVSDPIGDGDMGVTKYAGPNVKPQVRNRVIVHDLALRLRFFDGYDWPELLDEKARAAPRCEAFLIPVVTTKTTEDEAEEAAMRKTFVNANDDRKAKLMGDLLSGNPGQGSTFQNIPLPEERGKSLKEQAELRRLARRTSKYFQVAASGVSARLDSMEESSEHRLVSCLNLKVQDMFLAETISSNRPVKMLGEWFNEQEHPRDSNDGLIMLKMVTWHPLHRITSDGEVANDESDVGLKILPLRCIIDQRAGAFARAFFQSDDDQDSPADCLPPHLHAIPPPLFTMFRVRAFKLKVDYRPQKLDTKALRNGAVVELINLSPLDGMVLTLKDAEVVNEVGFGSVISILAGRWLQDICSTQLHKFVANSRPLEPITEVSGAAADMVVLPWDAFRNGDSIQKALKSGAKTLSKTFVYEFLSLSSRVAEYFASNVSRSVSHHQGVSGGELLPSRPLTIPRDVLDAGPHAVESLSRGFQAANYKIVIVPYREYQRTGATGAARSVLKGIPVAIAAPASGAAEALSFALLGARNQIRPDIRKEDEASLRGLHME